MTLQIDIWSDIACPWCYIGKRRFEKALAEFEHRDQLAITWHSFQLDPTMPDLVEGTERDYLGRRKGIPAAQVDDMLTHVTAQAADEGLAYDFDRLVVANSLKGHRLLHTAKAAGADVDGIKEALLSAHFEKGENIGELAVLERIGVAHGLTAEQVREGQASQAVDDAIQNDIATAASVGIHGVPFFVLGGKYGVSGAQPSDVFVGALEHVWQEMQAAAPSLITLEGSDEGDACGPDGC